MEIKMIVKCPCGIKLRATHEQMGKKARCPSCKRILLIPMRLPARNHAPGRNEGGERQATAAGQPQANNEGKLDARKSNVETNCDKTKLNSQGASSPTVQSPNMSAWHFPKTADKQELEDRSSQAGGLWSRSIIEEGNKLCPHCQKRVPDSFDRCSHCGKYFNETQREDDYPNIENNIGRPKFKFMSTLHKVFRRGAA